MMAKKIIIGCIVSISSIWISTAVAQYDRTVSAGDFALPVTLLDFSASGGDDAIILNWTTGSEVDVVGYNLYRSTDESANFSVINETLIPSHVNGPQVNEYQYIDYELEVDIDYYYRLASVELNGCERLIGSTIMSRLCLDNTDLTFSLEGSYPDPFNSQATIFFTVYERDLISLQIYNLKGRKVATLLERVLTPGSYVESFNGDKLPSGVYLCQLRGRSGLTSTQKMVLLR